MFKHKMIAYLLLLYLSLDSAIGLLQHKAKCFNSNLTRYGIRFACIYLGNRVVSMSQTCPITNNALICGQKLVFAESNSAYESGRHQRGVMPCLTNIVSL